MSEATAGESVAAEGRFSPGPFREKPEIVASPPSGIQRPVQVFPDHLLSRSPSWLISLGCSFQRWWSDFKHLWSSYHMTPVTQTSSCAQPDPVASRWLTFGHTRRLQLGRHCLCTCVPTSWFLVRVGFGPRWLPLLSSTSGCILAFTCLLGLSSSDP